MNGLESDESFKSEEKTDVFLAVLCFSVFIFVGYLLTHFLPR
jgi:hypothetical protein